MTKINVLSTILNLIFLIIFNAVFFLVGGTDHNTSVWISYGFIHFAYIMVLLTPKLTRSGKSSAVFGFAISSISSAYFVVQLVIGVIFILIGPESINAALLTQLCLAGVYGIVLLINLIANEHTANAEEARQPQIAYVKEASARVKTLMNDISDKEALRSVEKVYDALYSSPVKTHPNLANMEERILISIDALAQTAATSSSEIIISQAKSLLAAVNERNLRLQSFN